MYEVQLMNSYFPAQDDADLRDITIGDFLQDTANAFPDNVAMVDIDEKGDACSSWTYQELFLEAKKFQEANTCSVSNYSEFKEMIDKGAFIQTTWDGSAETEASIKKETNATIRCILFDSNIENKNCIYSSEPAEYEVIFAKAY